MARRGDDVLWRPGVKRLSANPAAIPPLLTASGMILNSRSTNVATTSIERKTHTDSNVGNGTSKAAVANNIAVTVSTITYLGLIRSWQCVQRRPRRNQLRIGIFSFHGMECLQNGQKDRAGFASDMPRGMRWMQTFRKDPMIAPKKKPVAMRMCSTVIV